MNKSAKRVAAGKKSRRKGAGFELQAAKDFQAWWGKGSFARSPSSGGWGQKPVRDDFRACGDVITTAEDFPWVIECKNQEGWTLDQLLLNEKCIIWSWWKQVTEETSDGLIPMLVFKKNRQPPMVMVPEGSYPFSDKYFTVITEKEVLNIFALSDLFKANPDHYRLDR